MGFVSHKAEVLAELDSASRRAMTKCGSVAEGHAKDKCPVDTGNLRRSIGNKIPDEKTAVIGTNVEYAA